MAKRNNASCRRRSARNKVLKKSAGSSSNTCRVQALIRYLRSKLEEERIHAQRFRRGSGGWYFVVARNRDQVVVRFREGPRDSMEVKLSLHFGHDRGSFEVFSDRAHCLLGPLPIEGHANAHGDSALSSLLELIDSGKDGVTIAKRACELSGVGDPLARVG